MTDWKTGFIKLSWVYYLLNSIYSYVKLHKNHYTERSLKSLLVYLLGRKIKKEKVNKILPKEV